MERQRHPSSPHSHHPGGYPPSTGHVPPGYPGGGFQQFRPPRGYPPYFDQRGGPAPPGPGGGYYPPHGGYYGQQPQQMYMYPPYGAPPPPQHNILEQFYGGQFSSQPGYDAYGSTSGRIQDVKEEDLRLMAKESATSRWIQRRIEMGDPGEIKCVVDTLRPDYFDICINKCGHHIFLALISRCSPEVEESLKIFFLDKFAALTVDKHSSRILQKAADVFSIDSISEFMKLIPELPNILEVCCDQNGNHVVQSFLKRSGSADRQPFLRVIVHHCKALLENDCGCRVLQTGIDLMSQALRKETFAQLVPEMDLLVVGEHANYVLQQIYEFGDEKDREEVLKHLMEQITLYTTSKHGTHVFEKVMQCSTSEQRIDLCKLVLSIPEDAPNSVGELCIHQYGNYVVQCLLKDCPAGPEKDELVKRCNYYQFMKESKFGKFVIDRLKLLHLYDPPPSPPVPQHPPQQQFRSEYGGFAPSSYQPSSGEFPPLAERRYGQHPFPPMPDRVVSDMPPRMSMPSSRDMPSEHGYPSHDFGRSSYPPGGPPGRFPTRRVASEPFGSFDGPTFPPGGHGPHSGEYGRPRPGEHRSGEYELPLTPRSDRDFPRSEFPPRQHGPHSGEFDRPSGEFGRHSEFAPPPPRDFHDFSSSSRLSDSMADMHLGGGGYGPRASSGQWQGAVRALVSESQPPFGFDSDLGPRPASFPPPRY